MIVKPVNHSFYGRIKLLQHDLGISQHVADGVTLWEPGIVNLFAREFIPGRNVLDVGANLGLHTLALAKLATRGEQVYALEPQPQLYALLRHNCRGYPQVHCYRKAAVELPGDYRMEDISDKPNPGGCGLGTGTYQVTGVTLDSLAFTNIGLMKVDVECFELECLRGARKIIQRDRPTLIVEVLGGSNPDTAEPEVVVEIQQRIAAIRGMGYRATRITDHDYLFQPN